MVSLLLGNKYLAIAKWIAIAGAVFYISHTWDKAQNYDALQEKYQLEVDCSATKTETSMCLSRAHQAAEAGAKAVTNAIAEIKAQEAKAAQDRKRQADADKEASDKAINEANHAKDLWEQRYQNQLATDKDCAAWSMEKVRCSLK